MMRLRRLTLDLFGQFTDKTHDFGSKQAGKPDFHIIYGPNEAGKTTTMEAYLRLLYGFKPRENYDFLHQRKNLRVSGTLEMDGATRMLTRLPKRDNSLVDDAGNAVPEMILQNALGRLGIDDYRQLLCLDDETIEQGGLDIVSSRGDIGKLLFSAAAGIGDLTGVLDRFREKADGLFRKRASSTEIARLKKELGDVEKRIRDLDIPASAFRKLRQAYDLAQQQEEEARSGRQKLRQQYALTDAKAKALPLIGRIMALDTALQPYAEYPRVLDFNPEDLVELLTRQSSAQAEAARLEKLIGELRQQRAAITRHPEWLDLQEPLDALGMLRGRVSASRIDLKRRFDEQRENLAEMRLLAHDLRAKPDLDPRDIVPTQIELAELVSAQDDLRDKQKTEESEQNELDRIRSRLDQAIRIRDQLNDALPEASGIGQILERFSVDSLAPQYATATQAIADAEARQQDALLGLTLRGRVFDALPRCSIDTHEAEEIALDHRRLADKLENAREGQRQIHQDLSECEAEIGDLIGTQGLISDQQAQAQLAARNEAWHAHLADLSKDSAAAFETRMQEVDNSAQARLAHASDQARLRHAQEQLSKLQVRRDHQARSVAELESRLHDLQNRIDTATRDFDLGGQVTPASFAAWISKHETASRLTDALARARKQHEPVLDRARRLQAALVEVIDLDTADFATMIARARSLYQDERAFREQLSQANQACRDLQADQDARAIRLDASIAARQDSEASWRDLIAKTFKGHLDSETLKQSIAPLATLRELSVRHDNLQKQIRGMEADQRDYAARLHDLATEFGADPELAPDDAYAGLRDMAERARAGEDLYMSVSQQIDAATKALQPEHQALEQIAATTRQMAALFPPDLATDHLTDLRQRVLEAQAAIRDRQHHQELSAQVCALLDVRTLEDAMTQVQDSNAAQLAADLSDLSADLAHAETELDGAIARRSAAGHELTLVTGDAEIAELTERKTTLETQIEEGMLGFIQLDLGHRLAEEAIRRYRDSHRGAMIEATENAFRDLTNGAYERLQTHPAGNTEILVALDRDGTAKQAQDMSKGTRFQLFLALRAAAYEQLVAQGTCLPFFCDDIFETFDEERTRSACRLMARIGHIGQAIYLTHHRHVVDIAREEIGADLTLHEL